MTINDTLTMAWHGLATHKSRSALTVLGIVIGIASIILIMSIGQSAQNLILGEVQSFGPQNIFIIPGRQANGPTGASGTLLSDSLKQKDFEDLQKKANIPNAVGVVGFVFSPVTATYGTEIFNATMLGGTSNITKAFKLEIAEGRFFDNDDVLQRAQVVVLGSKVADKLFGSEYVIGQRVKIKNNTFRVIGVMGAKGQSQFMNFDESILSPYTTTQQYVLGIRHLHRVIVEADSIDSISAVTRDITTLLRNNHNITDPEKDDFFIQTQADIVDTISTVTNVMTVLLSAIAAVSLVVGGIGIMNIMFVSVTERTREIGLRKALGATNKDILVQFLTEAVILTGTGGLVGIATGTAMSAAATFIANYFFAIGFGYNFSVLGAFLGVMVSSTIGFIFGIFPARQASRKSPIEALRYE